MTTESIPAKPTVLFICQHNAGRSQLGAHLLDLIAPGQFVSTSAGLKPAAEINPVVAESLNELGADTSAARPRLVTEDWDLDGVRGMRDAVAAQVRKLAAELTTAR